MGEAYMDGTLTIDGDDLHGLLSVILQNYDDAPRLRWQRWHIGLRARLRRLMQYNPAVRSRRNVAHHYDLSGELYALFLDNDRQYSCGYFRDPQDTLEQAQEQKKEHIARKLRLAPGMRVLDIGCGWGGLGLTLARDHGAQVLGVTLSTEQHELAQKRARSEGLSDKVDFRLTDYRDVTGQFDRIVSVGMFEHVGLPQYGSYFSKVHELLAPEGIALVHTIGNSCRPAATNPWIAKYIFPGSYVPSMSELTASIENAGLWTDDIEVWRLHYALTLRKWFDRFVAEESAARRLYDERFVRMWKFYLAACEMTFRHRHQAVFQVQLSHKVDAVPITRDYLYATPNVYAAKDAAE